MCGIYGVISNQKNQSQQTLRDCEKEAKILFKKSLRRGSEATGFFIVDNKHVNIIKSSQNVKKIYISDAYRRLKDTINNETIKAIVGQTRMATHGNVKKYKNNQPVISKYKTIIGVHNGLVANYQLLHNPKYQLPELDTQVLIDYLEKEINKIKVSAETLKKIFKQLSKKAEGIINLAIFLTKNSKLILYSNNGSLYYLENEEKIYFASESLSLESFSKSNIVQIKDEIKIFSLSKNKPKYVFKDFSKNNIFKNKLTENKNFINKIEFLKKHRINEKSIAKIPRCSKCILPNTTPFIKFDRNGVCNYCRDHHKINYLGTKELETILSRYRSKSDKADCLVAFSGGRDSSYGLHLVKNKLGMNPIAFTYDWGMITDLGRRNQSKILSQLKVEQILVSANIAKKRRDIRQNILAWIKKPNLAMVPIFMQGDKQCEYYADQIMRQYQIPLMIYFRGNELEKEEFKAGLCGITDADPKGVIHDLSGSSKLRLLTFYAKEYLKNPNYINSSLMDVAFAYFSTYLKPHNYLYLWHYLPWKEKEIVETLTSRYNWELSKDTSTSWRIGDGSSAFYNYIYYQVQGFTENDSLRSRQIRENIISREKALELVQNENKVQYHNLKWYFDTLNLDGDKILGVVDKMDKKYEL